MLNPFFIYKSKVGNHNRGWPEGSFSIATKPRSREGCYFFPWIILFILDPYLIILSVKRGGIKCHSSVFSMTIPGIEPPSPGLLSNPLSAKLMGQILSICSSISNNSLERNLTVLMSRQFNFKQFSLARILGLNFKTVSPQAIQFSISILFSSIWPIDRTLSVVTTRVRVDLER